MDPSLVLEQTIQDVSNLPSEFRYLLEEIGSNDLKLNEETKIYEQKESQIHKFIKQQGSIPKHPQEDELDKEIKESLSKCQSLQREKCVLANTALFLIARHLNKLENNITLLEEDGVLAPVEEDGDADSAAEASRESSVMSTGSLKKKRAASSSGSVPPTLKKKKTSRTSKLQNEIDVSSTEKSVTPCPNLENKIARTKEIRNNRNGKGQNGSLENEDEDKTLYCFCQRVSFGEMVACDGPNCKYEWFHYDCVSLKEPPKGTWYCPECKIEMEKNKLKRKRN
ncbi:yng2p [Saccharomyces arboricola H-6]|uniref:Chromatin modification-related protein n=1 Tax=Saccharomyces arboricola (strain H-6 / AS 2.3317 / CBS 10644) TaxID=1160507 RepID=J8Q477_SACAR|nr:yng2p [Saccharomyces arboricola H-6]